jgi:hypothetical protein
MKRRIGREVLANTVGSHGNLERLSRWSFGVALDNGRDGTRYCVIGGTRTMMPRHATADGKETKERLADVEEEAARAQVGSAGEPAQRRTRSARRKGAGRMTDNVASGVMPRSGENGAAEAMPPLKSIAGSDSARLNTELLRAVLGCVPCSAAEAPEIREQRVGAALDAVKGFGPRDAVEGMLAAQAVAMHLAGIAALQRSQRPDLPVEVASKLRRDGAGLCRGVVEMAEAIGRRRDGGARQVVRVERVVVEEGGQAIVGAVAPPGRGPLATRDGGGA